MEYLQTAADSECVNVEDILYEMFNGLPFEHFGSVWEDAGVSHGDHSAVPSSTFVPLKQAMAPPENPHHFIDLQPMTCDLDTLVSSQVSEVIARAY